MFDSFRRLIGAEPKADSSQASFQQLNAVAPLRPAQPGAGAAQKNSSFICREAILDRNERIAGYEFALGRELQARMLDKSALIRRVYDETMLANLAPLRVAALLGERKAVVRLSVDSLDIPQLQTLANSNSVLMITPRPLAEMKLEQVAAQLAQLKAQGILHGWSLSQPRPELAALLRQADYIEIDTTTFDGIQLQGMLGELRKANPAQKLIASKLQTEDDFRYCYHGGFDYFKGPFVSSRENWHPAKSEVNHLRVFEALELIRKGAEFDEIADNLRTDPILTFKLLRYINSPGIGLLQKVTEIQQALMLLGREKFYRWLSLLLFDAKQPGYHENVIREQALTRGRFMELLAGKGQVPAAADQLFLTGLFSMMHVMLGQSQAEVLKQVALPEAVAAALNGEASPLGDALQLAVAAESLDEAGMAAAAARCGVEADDVAGMVLEALSWAHQIVAVGE